MSPHSLVQQLLNRSESHLWAFVSNGLRLRVLRDSASMTGQSYVEFDLEAMMDGEVYPDFVLLWMLCHQSRVEVAEGERAETCWLEQWSQAAQEQGSRALDRLRDGVEKAIQTLGSGFLSHRENAALKKKLSEGDLHVQDYYRQLLRLVYRMLFLFVAEDRGHLLDPDADGAARDRYTRFYSTRKLRDHAEKRVGGRHPDLYRQLAFVMKMLGEDDGCPALALPALGGFLFDEGAAPDLAAADIANRGLLDAVRALAFVDQGAGLTPVDYEHLGAEELGSVYESLLELAPVLDPDSGAFALEAVGGNERKTTGSYYTPDQLVTSLLDTALDPVLDEAAKKPDPEHAILALKVCDPAVGSGHFLIRAAHRIAHRLAAARTKDDEPAPGPYREALRDVIGRCLYGVDVNPMSAELCRFNLLLEGLAPGKPLSFLEGHIKVGNSLLGTTPDLIRAGIPDDAFKPIEGDDKQTVSAYRKRNKAAREAWESGQTVLDLRGYEEEGEKLRRGYELLEASPDGTVREVREKQARYAALEDSEEMFHARRLADAWCATFVWPKTREVSMGAAPPPITQETFSNLALNAHTAGRETEKEIERLACDYGFFHWHVAFPNVFGAVEEPGFDVVLGNPPWEHTELKEQEWFAARNPEVAAAPGAKRKRMIEALKDDDPALYTAFKADLRLADGFSHYVRNSGRFPLCGKGRINTYAIFAETKRDIISDAGRVGCIVPSGIATDNTTKDFFADLVSTQTLASLYDFENKGIFVDVDSRMKFSLLTLTGARRPARAAEFAFFCHAVSDLRDPERRFPLSAEDIRLLNPNTRTCPIFRTRRDAEITKEIYRRVPVLIDENKNDGNPWSITFKQGLFNMTSDSGLFRTREELEADGWELAEPGNVFTAGKRRYLPLYEAKMLHHYDHRWATYTNATDSRLMQPQEKEDPESVAQPRYWAPETEVRERLRERWDRDWLLGFRNVCRSTDERTMLTGIIAKAGVGHSAPIFLSEQEAVRVACLESNLISFTLDYVLRQKLGGINLTFGYLSQVPVLPPETYDAPAAWEPGSTLSDWISSRVLELTYTAWDLASFARDLGHDGPPFAWDPERRFRLRCELDAAYFHLYGIAREDVEYIMDTFPIVRRKDEAAHGEYRTRRVILEIYDQMAAATPGATTETTPEPETPPATVTHLRPRPRDEGRDERTQPAEIAAEERGRYDATPRRQHENPAQTKTEAPVDAIHQNAGSPQLPPEHRGDGGPARPEERQPTLPGQARPDPPAPEAPNPYNAALALNACLPDGQKVPKDALFQAAARELGYPKLTKKVRSALNKALNAEHNAGRLKTDWKLVWRPKR
ncbi:MAG: N-6 DNA methylase [Rubrobacteraceae bacterium]